MNKILSEYNMQPINHLDTHNMNKILKEYNMQPINHLDTHNMNKILRYVQNTICNKLIT